MRPDCKAGVEPSPVDGRHYADHARVVGRADLDRTATMMRRLYPGWERCSGSWEGKSIITL